MIHIDKNKSIGDQEQVCHNFIDDDIKESGGKCNLV